MLLSSLFAIWPAHGQGQATVPVQNALVVMVQQNNAALQPILGQGGTPSGIEKVLSQAEPLLSVQVPRAQTNSTGHFEIPAASGSTYNLTVSAPGYVQTISSTVSMGESSGVPSNLTLVVQPSAVISGEVTDSSGNPLPGIMVSTGQGPFSTNYDVTMDDGIFVLDSGLTSGNHTIYAFKPNQDLTKASAIFSKLGISVPQYNTKIPFNSPQSGFATASVTTNLEQGKLTHVNIRLNTSATISGTVLDEKTRNPITHVPVLLFDKSGNIVDAAVTDSFGKYTFDNGLGPESYAVILPAQSTDGKYCPTGRNVTAPASNVNLYLVEGNSISGTVVDANGKAIQGATVIGPQLISPEKFADGLATFLATSSGLAKTGTGGSFTLKVPSTDNFYTIRAYYGDALPVSGSTVVTPTAKAAQLALNFSDVVTVHGRVEDSRGQAIPNARIIPAFATSIPASANFAAMSSKDGSFVMTVPIKDPKAASLFDSVVVYAPGYDTATAMIASDETVVKMSRPADVLVGRVLTQGTFAPSIETALERKGTVLVSDGNRTFAIGASTNSKITDASFNFTSKQILLHLEGMQGSLGKSEFTLPRDILGGPFVVRVDGRTLASSDVSISQNNTSVAISFNHDHGARLVEIQGTTAVPEFPLPAIIAAAGIAVSIALIRRFWR